MCINVIIFYYEKQKITFDILKKSQKCTLLFTVRFLVILSFKIMNYMYILYFTSEIRFCGYVTSGTIAQTSCRLELGPKSNKYFITSFLFFHLKPQETDENIIIVSSTYKSMCFTIAQ